MDTGSSCDLVQLDSMPGTHEQASADTKTLETANGVVTTSRALVCEVTPLHETITPHVVADTPPVLSVGQRCMDGCAFHWEPYQLPVFVTAEGKQIVLDVENGLPWLTPSCIVAMPAVQDVSLVDEESLWNAAFGPDDPGDDLCSGLTMHMVKELGDQKVPEGELQTDDDVGLDDVSEGIVLADTKVPPAHVLADSGQYLAHGTDVPMPVWLQAPHVMTHKPKLSQCPVCMRALAKKKPSRRKKGEFADEPDVQPVFGAIITADHIVYRPEQEGLNADKQN